MQTISNIHVLKHYLGKQFFSRFLSLLFGLSAMLLLFDILANADEVLEFQNDLTGPIFQYGLLRLPIIMDLVIPFSALLSFMIVFSNMVKSQELIALRSVGVSVYRLILLSSFVAGLIAISHFLFANTAVPSAQIRLKQWAYNDYKGTAGDETLQASSQWFETGNDFIRIGEISDDGKHLRDVDFVQRNKDGDIQAYFEIQDAFYNGDGWRVITSQNMQLSLSLPLSPGSFKNIRYPVAERSYGSLMKAVLENKFVNEEQKRQHYLWLQQKLAAPLGVFIMLLLAAPLALQLARRDTLMRNALFVILAGFSYFIFQQLLLSLGEAQYLPGIIAVWSPLVIFSVLGFWILLMLEE